jgi:hypothetical protein
MISVWQTTTETPRMDTKASIPFENEVETNHWQCLPTETTMSTEREKTETWEDLWDGHKGIISQRQTSNTPLTMSGQSKNNLIMQIKLKSK